MSFHVDESETLGLVGESGCGKTSTGRCLVRAIDPSAGQILFDKGDGAPIDVARVSGNTLKALRRDMQMIFQDPFSSLNPRWTLLDLVGEPLVAFGVAKGRELEDRVALLLKRVGLRPEYIRRYPHAFSGGERQRIGIARALALNPKLVVADEPVSALDVSVRAQTLNLLNDLQSEFGLTYVFISHDLSVVQHICNRVAVMYVGKIVEVGETDELFGRRSTPIPRRFSLRCRNRTLTLHRTASCCAARSRIQATFPRVARFTLAAPMPSTFAGRLFRSWSRRAAIAASAATAPENSRCAASKIMFRGLTQLEQAELDHRTRLLLNGQMNL